MPVITILSAALVGVEARPVAVEVATTHSLPGITTVGLPDAALREGRERVWLALRHSDLLTDRPSAVVNLAPAELRKTGSAYELPTALGLLAAREKVPREAVEGLLVVGELSLNGAIRPVRGVLAMADLARTLGVRAMVVPAANAREASLIAGLRVLAASNLKELARGLRGEASREPFEATSAGGEGEVAEAAHAAGGADFADLRGQDQARRAAEVAAAGGHNLLLVGPPGSGKTMIARRLPGLLPPLAPGEAIEVTRIHSAAGLLGAGGSLLRRRPFRAPHHTISPSGLVGGFVPPRPGEVSLAHRGVLFLDELPEFPRSSLEALREPLEVGSIDVVRGGFSVRFPARSLLVAAMNPCPCGDLGDPQRPCRCGPGMVARYRGRISGPLLDRIDLHIEVPRLRAADISRAAAGASSAVMAERVSRARAAQASRRLVAGVRLNGELPDGVVRGLVPLEPGARRALDRAVEALGLSARAWVRILRVARTIADLDGIEAVDTEQVLEAIQYRALDRRLA